MNHKADLATIVKLRTVNGLSWNEISTQTGVPKATLLRQFSNVCKMLDPEGLQTYRDSRVPLLTAMEAELLRLMGDPVRLKKASVNNLAYAFYQINNARRLEEGRATQNIDLRQTLLTLQADARKVRSMIDTIESTGT
jgi:hypothetical protein